MAGFLGRGFDSRRLHHFLINQIQIYENDSGAGQLEIVSLGEEASSFVSLSSILAREASSCP
jgi:hypothetical protein